MTKEELAGMIDHTFLKATGDSDAIERLCREATEYKFACAMVNPCEVRRAATLLGDSGVRVGTVIGFPLGANCPQAKVFEAGQAIQDGALDLDFVINIRKLKAAVSSKEEYSDLAQWLHVYNGFSKHTKPGVVTKLIIECCYLTDEEKELGCRLAKAAGFDFVKTSTGFGTGGATVRDVELMRRVVGSEMGVKAAGGIRTLEDALALLKAGANRLGCSAGVEIVNQL